jgi:DNA-binding CsgD family transcriptional regulator
LLNGLAMQHLLDERFALGESLAILWHRLCEGQLFIRDTYCSNGRCYAALEIRAVPIKPSAIKVRVLERIFAGEGQKAVAADMGVSVASVAGYSLGALMALTCRQRVSRAPILLVMGALAARGSDAGPVRDEGSLADGTWLVSVEIPGRTFRDRLSWSEAEVVRLSIEGEGHDGVAAARGTSIRTVANQLASAFGKLKVSGRSSLRALAVREHAAWLRSRAPVAPPAGAPSLRAVLPLPAGSWRDVCSAPPAHEATPISA